MINLVNAYLDDYQLINVYINKCFHNGISQSFYLIEDDKKSELKIVDTFDNKSCIKYSLAIDAELIIGKNYKVSVVDNYTTDLKYRDIVKTDRFNNEFYYEGDDLGSTIIDNKTVFKLWAPTATSVYCFIDNEFREMIRREKGIYELVCDNNLTGHAYQYLINVNGETNLTNDIYAKASLPNNKASVVCSVDKEIVEEDNSNSNDAIIYETSVRDSSKEGTFKSFDFDYIKSLGVTHIQLLPVQDFATVNEYHKEIFYNWGYDTINYQCLEGSYSSDINNPTKVINDFKLFMKSAHNKNLSIILDIVFNHCYNGYTSHFNKTVPYYYFRFNEDNMLAGTGCGNEIATEQSMCRKYIIDTLKYYVECFNVDGFRFDLMSFIDTETMNMAYSALSSIKKDILLYGEGWDMSTGLNDNIASKRRNAIKIPQVGFFNDTFRNIVLGDLSNYSSCGYINGNVANTEIMSQLLINDNFQTINYVQCHDNLTCFDRIKKNEERDNVAYDKAKIANALVLLSYSIPFIGAGQEFAISKEGFENNYNSPDNINKLCNRYVNDDVLEFTKKIILFRKSSEFYKERPNIVKNDSGIIILEIKKYRFVFNCSNDYYYYNSNDRLLLYSNNDLSDYKNMKPFSMLILEKVEL